MQFTHTDWGTEEPVVETYWKIMDMPYFWCDHCGEGPYRFSHPVDGKKYCQECWLMSLPDRD
jgi:hypothetical protein